MQLTSPSAVLADSKWHQPGVSVPAARPARHGRVGVLAALTTLVHAASALAVTPLVRVDVLVRHGVGLYLWYLWCCAAACGRGVPMSNWGLLWERACRGALWPLMGAGSDVAASLHRRLLCGRRAGVGRDDGLMA